MSRQEFMAQLTRLLQDLPPNDREDAIAYYNDYFDEAGPENEASVIQELGSPGKVAGIIKADLQENTQNSREYTETGYHDESFERRNTPASVNHRQDGYQEPKQRSRFPVALLIVILVFTSPLWIGAFFTVGGVLLGILCVLIGIICAIFFGGIGLVLGGATMIVGGIVKMFTLPAAGIAVLGGGMICVAIGILFLLAFLWIVVKVLPKIFRWFVDTCSRLIHNGQNNRNDGRNESSNESRNDDRTESRNESKNDDRNDDRKESGQA